VRSQAELGNEEDAVERVRAGINPLILSGAPSGAQSKDLSNSSHEPATIELFERSFDSGFAFAQDQVLKSD
jgi:hypothetical protein